MKAVDLDRLEGLLKAATPYEWEPITNNEFATIGNCGGAGFGISTPGIPGGNYRDTEFGSCEADEALIVAMHNALPELLRIARAVAEAPVGDCIGQSGWGSQPTGAIILLSNPEQVKGKRVRLVVVEGDGNGHD